LNLFSLLIFILLIYIVVTLRGNLMKSFVIAGAFVASCVVSSMAAAGCAKPAAKPEIPDAATVVTAQMVKANNDMKAYVKDVETYLGCAGLPRSEEKKELESLKQFAEDFNQVVRAFKARSAG
jgi:outer membrane murein-binding lipoprotein Lpp